MEKMFLEPIIQYAFAGFCAILLGIIVWLIKQLLAVIEKNNSIIAALSKALSENTAAVTAMHSESTRAHEEQITATYKLRDRLVKVGSLDAEG